MRRVVLSLAVVGLIAFMTSTASAQRLVAGSGRGFYVIQGNNGYQEQGVYGWSNGTTRSSYSFNDAVSRIRAKYSNYRFNPHPLSNYKSGPSLYEYGW